MSTDDKILDVFVGCFSANAKYAVLVDGLAVMGLNVPEFTLIAVRYPILRQLMYVCNPSVSRSLLVCLLFVVCSYLI